MQNNIVIIGIGVVSSIGIGKDAFWQALQEGKSGVKPVTLFDTSNLKVKMGAEISDFNPAAILGEKGLRNLDRATKLLLCAGKLALDDAKIEINEENSTNFGISIGTTLGSLWSISEFDKSALRDGPHFVNPAEFPNTVINSPPSQLAIRLKVKGPCATISSGFTSSLDALKYGVDLIRNKRCQIVLAGGVEEFCAPTYLGFYRVKFLAGVKGEELSCPFDQRRNGGIFGEGSAILALESEESATKRGANIYARILGFGTHFYPYAINKYEPQGHGLKKAMRFALDDAGVSASEVDYISSAANSSQDADAIETGVVKDDFGAKAKEVAISAPKSMLGETFSAAGVLAATATIGAMQKGFIPATLNYKEKDKLCDLDYVPNKSRAATINKALINAFGPSGSNSCLVVAKI
jgi:3-oxoacyl-[acyl-carrier-protein] synthase II